MNLKKFIAVILIIAMCLTFTACNYKPFDTNWQFNYAYITFPDGHIEEIEINKWAEDDTSVTIQSDDGNVYCVSMMNCMMTKKQWEEFK